MLVPCWISLTILPTNLRVLEFKFLRPEVRLLDKALVQAQPCVPAERTPVSPPEQGAEVMRNKLRGWVTRIEDGRAIVRFEGAAAEEPVSYDQLVYHVPKYGDLFK